MDILFCIILLTQFKQLKFYYPLKQRDLRWKDISAQESGYLRLFIVKISFKLHGYSKFSPLLIHKSCIIIKLLKRPYYHEAFKLMYNHHVLQILANEYDEVWEEVGYFLVTVKQMWCLYYRLKLFHDRFKTLNLI